jgi:RHS repeat-associated protein
LHTATILSANYEYDPFGQSICATGLVAKENPFRFSTKRTDNTTDLVLYEYRVYVPSTGRWPSRDPIAELGGKNLYGFCGNAPITYIDPFGNVYWGQALWGGLQVGFGFVTGRFKTSHERSN